MATAGAQRLQAGMRRPGTKPAILDHADGVSMLGWRPVGALYDGVHAPQPTPPLTHLPGLVGGRSSRKAPGRRSPASG